MKTNKLMTALIAGILTIGGITSAQTRAEAPDTASVNLGVVSTFNGSPRPALNLYGNVTLTERLARTTNGALFGTVQIGNDFYDFRRLYVDGKVDYVLRNVTLSAAVRQGFYTLNDGFGNRGTSVRFGTQVRF